MAQGRGRHGQQRRGSGERGRMRGRWRKRGCYAWQGKRHVSEACTGEEKRAGKREAEETCKGAQVQTPRQKRHGEEGSACMIGVPVLLLSARAKQEKRQQEAVHEAVLPPLLPAGSEAEGRRKKQQER